MRKIKAQLQLKLPSWNFCNYDGFTADDRYSKDLCKFCVKSKQGYRCMLLDQDLTADPRFVHKAASCIKMCGGDSVEVNDGPSVDPKLIIKETLKTYKKTVDDLKKQGYPQNMADTIATKYILGER